MSRESTYQAIILKLQPFQEADEIITFYTAEAGKIRALAKSVKLPTSKLRQSLQPMFLVEATLTRTGKLPKVIRSTVLEAYQVILADAERLSRWFVAAELIMRATADEQKNPDLFLLLQNFLRFLNRPEILLQSLDSAMVKFKIELLSNIGLGVWYPAEPGESPRYFSNSRGGFFNTRLVNDAVVIDPQTWQAFLKIKDAEFEKLGSGPTVIEELQRILSNFLAYQLEREIKSERFVRGSNV